MVKVLDLSKSPNAKTIQVVGLANVQRGVPTQITIRAGKPAAPTATVSGLTTIRTATGERLQVESIRTTRAIAGQAMAGETIVSTIPGLSIAPAKSGSARSLHTEEIHVQSLPMSGVARISANAPFRAVPEGKVKELSIARVFRTSDDLTTNISVDRDETRKTLTIDTKDSAISPVLRMLALRSKASIVIKEGTYERVTLVLSDVTFEEALRIICDSGEATWRKEGNVYFISPKKTASIATTSPNP